MRPDGSMAPSKINRRMTASDGACDEMLIIIAGDMFAAGYDTRDIAIRTLTPECAVEAALHRARERQGIGI